MRLRYARIKQLYVTGRPVSVSRGECLGCRVMSVVYAGLGLSGIHSLSLVLSGNACPPGERAGAKMGMLGPASACTTEAEPGDHWRRGLNENLDSLGRGPHSSTLTLIGFSC